MEDYIKEICLKFIKVSEDNDDDAEIQRKIECLDELCEFLDEEDAVHDMSFYADVIEIIEENLFRVLPPSTIQKEYVNIGPGFDVYTNEEDPQMKILYSVYSLLFNFVESLKDSEIAEALIDDTFVENFFALLKSEDDSERSFVAKITKSIYTYLESRARKINSLIYQSLLEIINNKTVVYSSVDSLLEILLFIITNEDDESLLNPDSLFRVFISMHRLPYLFYFYQHLFSCCLLLLEARPSHIVSFMRNVLLIFTKEPIGQETASHLSTKRILCLMELKYVLDLLIQLIDGVDDEQVKKQFEDAFRQLVKPIVDFCLPNLKSYNIILVNWSIKILSCAEYSGYFHKHQEILQRVVPFMMYQPNYIEWDGATFTQQVLYRAQLNQICQ